MFILTGATDGIGLAAAHALAAGAPAPLLVMVGRSATKTKEAAAAVVRRAPSATVETEIADLSLLGDVEALASRLRERHPRIDALLNNAGALFVGCELTRDGIERTFALNHLAYFSLAVRLLPALASAARESGAASRIVNVSSRAHEPGRLRVDDIAHPAAYGAWSAYSASKLCNILFTRELARRVDSSALVTHAMHPGVVATRFAASNGIRGQLMRKVMDLVSISPEQGADTLVWLATADEALRTTGEYWVKRTRTTPSRSARDEVLARSLWTLSERLTSLDADRAIVEAGIGHHRG